MLWKICLTAAESSTVKPQRTHLPCISTTKITSRLERKPSEGNQVLKSLVPAIRNLPFHIVGLNILMVLIREQGMHFDPSRNPSICRASSVIRIRLSEQRYFWSAAILNTFKLQHQQYYTWLWYISLTVRFNAPYLQLVPHTWHQKSRFFLTSNWMIWYK